MNASNIFPEITLFNDRTVIYEDFVIYNHENNFFASNTNLPSSVNIDLNVVILGINTGNFEERTPFADAIVTLIQDLPQGYSELLTFCDCANVKLSQIGLGVSQILIHGVLHGQPL